MTQDVSRLDRLLKPLADARVVDYFSTDWCQMLNHGSEAFASRTDLSTCTLGTNARTFTPDAQQAFEHVRVLFGGSGLPIEQVSLTYAQGQVSAATFELSAPFQHWAYAYDVHGNGTIDPPNDRARVVNDQWTFWQDEKP
jgi:hypothetical protein